MRNTDYLYEGWQFALQRDETGNDKDLSGNFPGDLPEKISFAPVTLPHDWAIASPLNREMEQAQEQGFFDRWGVGWYKRKLTIHKQQDKVYLLCCDGIYENSTIWINGCPAGGRKYGYSSFSLDITGLVEEGENEILVKVDNTRRPVDRWYSGAGIYRKIYLQTLPKVHFTMEDVRTSMSFDGTTATLQIRTGMQVPVNAVLSKNGHIYQAESRTEGYGESRGQNQIVDQAESQTDAQRESCGENQPADQAESWTDNHRVNCAENQMADQAEDRTYSLRKNFAENRMVNQAEGRRERSGEAGEEIIILQVSDYIP